MFAAGSLDNKIKIYKKITNSNEYVPFTTLDIESNESNNFVKCLAHCENSMFDLFVSGSYWGPIKVWEFQ